MLKLSFPLFTLLLAGLALLTACGANQNPTTQPNLPLSQATPQPVSTAPAEPTKTSPLQPLHDYLKREYGMAATDLRLISMEEVEWPNSCLGLATPEELCQDVIVPGYRIVLETPQGNFEFHTAANLGQFRLADSGVPAVKGGLEDRIVLIWERSGGIAGICQQLSISLQGSYTLRDCRSQQMLGQGFIPNQQAAYIRQTANYYGEYTWMKTIPTGSADMINESYNLAGMGSDRPALSDQEYLNTLLVQLANQLLSEHSGPNTSGIEGLVTIGPVCPGPVKLNDPACADQPYQAYISVLDERRGMVTRFQSGVDGRFRVSLPAGKYILHPESETTLPSATDQPVEVLPGQFVTLQIVYDTGMR